VLAEARACTACAAELPHPPRPVLRAGRSSLSRVAIDGGTQVVAQVPAALLLLIGQIQARFDPAEATFEPIQPVGLVGHVSVNKAQPCVHRG
jgi:hypothetical protein